MNIPAAMMIESALDMPFGDAQKTDALKELHMAVAGRSVDFSEGYLLGLGTARVMVMTGGWSKDAIVEEVEHPPVTVEHVENPTPEQFKEAAREMKEATREDAPIVDVPE